MARKKKRATRRSSRSKTRAKRSSGLGCNCNAGSFLAGAIVLALGLFFLVWGVSTQWSTGYSAIGWVLLAYIVGIILISTGKMLKWKGHGSCRVHVTK